MKRRLCIFPLLALLLAGHLVYSQSLVSPQSGAANQPVLGTYNLGVLNLPPTEVNTPLHTSGQAMPFLSLIKTGTTSAEPGGLASYEIQLTNYEAVSRSFTLTEQLPDSLSLNGIEVASDTRYSLHYSRATHTLSWQGAVDGGHLDYTLHPEEAGPPYIDLGLYGAVNLCDAIIAAGQSCDDATVTFNLGTNGRTFPFYGRAFTNLTLSSDGILLMQEEPITSTLPNEWLPDTAVPGYLIAGLWRDNDLTSSGRWHAGIIAGWMNGLDVFYAQWQDVPQAANPNATARHAIALTLGQGGGDIYFIYDNISDPTAEIAQGYTIGLQDGIGERGLTYAYAPCCGESYPPRGYPPPSGTVLHLRPRLLAGDNPYRVTFRYQVHLDTDIPVGSFIPTTVIMQSDSPDPALNDQWATHYLFVREMLYLPLLLTGEEEE